MVRYFLEKLSSNSIKQRVLFSMLLFLALFLGVVVISYFFLPEGLLKSKNPLQNWVTSNNTFTPTLQIFFYNMLSVLVIVLGSLFGQKKNPKQPIFRSATWPFLHSFVSTESSWEPGLFQWQAKLFRCWKGLFAPLI